MVAFLLAGCYAERRQALERSVENFSRALKVGDLRAATSYVKPENREAFISKIQKIKNYEVSHCAVDSIIESHDENSATATLMMEIFALSSSEIQNIRPALKWSYNEKMRVWLIESETLPF